MNVLPQYYGLKLNYDKCLNIMANQRILSIPFSPNGPAQANMAEVLNRLADCIGTANRLKLFWQKA